MTGTVSGLADAAIRRQLERLEAERDITDWPNLLSTVQQIRDSHPELGPRLALRYLKSVHREARRISR